MVGMLCPCFLILSRGTAEASRYDFNGAGNGEIIVWDGSFDVSTESNDCNATTPICTTAVPVGFTLNLLLTGPGASITAFNQITAILMSSTANCQVGDSNC